MKIDSKDSMLVDIQYVKKNKQLNQPDNLYVIWKDLLTGKKTVETIPEPKMKIYFEKPEFRNHSYIRDYQEIKNTNPYTCKFSEIPFAIGNDWGEQGKQFIRNIFDTKDYSKFKEMNLYPYVFGHDFDVKTYYRYSWKKAMPEPSRNDINCAYFDIEADSFIQPGFADAETCPIDLMTIIDEKSNKSYTFALVGREYEEREYSHLNGEARKHVEGIEKNNKRWYDYRLKKEQELMDDQDGLKEELHALFDESYGDLDYNFYFYKDEKQMLVHIFQLINTIEPDFLLIWNIEFDIPYIIKRMKVLGLNPEDIICHPEFPTKECFFVKDKRNFDIKNKSSFFNVSSKTIYYDQMVLYAAKRKGQSELRSFSLGAIGKEEIGDTKLDYSEEQNIKKFPYLNYRKYFIYNIKDVLLQLGINRVTKDTDTLYVTSSENLTSYKDVWKQTVVLRNVQYRDHLDNGLIPGANENGIRAMLERNDFDEEEKKDEVGFEGALVGNTKLIKKFGVTVYGKPTNYLFKYSIDMDMSAFYPNTIYAMNICKSTLLFKIICDASQFDVRGGTIPFKGITDVQMVKDNDDSFTGDVAKEIIDNFQSKNYLSVGYKFMNLPSLEEVEDELIDMFNDDEDGDYDAEKIA